MFIYFIYLFIFIFISSRPMHTFLVQEEALKAIIEFWQANSVYEANTRGL